MASIEKNRGPFQWIGSSFEGVIAETRKAFFGNKTERQEEVIKESENFMKELWDIARNFKPLYNEYGDKIVYFDFEEKNGVISKCSFVDSRATGDRPRDIMFGNDWYPLWRLDFERINNSKNFSLLVGWWSARNWHRSRSTTSPEWYHKNLPELLAKVKRVVNEINRKRDVSSKIAENLSKENN